MAHHQLLAVGGNENNMQMLVEFLEDHSYDVVARENFADLTELVDSDPHLNLVLIDLSRFEPEGWQPLAALRKHNIPFLVFTGSLDPDAPDQEPVQQAEQVMGKPLNPDELLHVVQSVVDG